MKSGAQRCMIVIIVIVGSGGVVVVVGVKSFKGDDLLIILLDV